MRLINCPLKENVINNSEQIAIISDRISITYGQLDNIVDATIKKLKDIGVRKNDNICIVSPPSIEYIITLFALWRIRAVACLLSEQNTKSYINEQVKKIQAKLLLSGFSEITCSKLISIEKTQLKDIVDINLHHYNTGIENNFNGYPSSQPSTIMFTSGSSADSKAVLHSYGNHYYNAKGSNENIPVRIGDRWFLSLPLYHVSGLSILFRCLIGGATIVLSEDRSDLHSLIDRFNITHISLVATQLFKILSDKKTSSKFKKLKAMLLGGSAFPEKLLHSAINAELPVYLSYGLTEMASQVATSALLSKTSDLSRVKVLPYRRVKIADDGEILLSGKTLFKGYLSEGKIQNGTDSEGWFHSKDTGQIANRRFLTVKGRKDNMFISGGENIFPEEIEYYLHKLESLENAIVIPVPDDKYGFRPIAFVKPARDAHLSRKVLIEHLTKYLPKFKIPDNFYLWPNEIQIEGIKISRRKFIKYTERENLESNLIT
jgi:O-succinylbenzoic acid--CoA ligase